jgi:hypothetical protein
MLVLADESLISKVLNKLVVNNAFHYLAHCTSKRDRTVIVKVA